MSKTVLLVTTDYPPLAGTSTRWGEALARYLPDYGWNPIILTLAVEDMALIESSWKGDGLTQTLRVGMPGIQAAVRRFRGQRPRLTGSGSEGNDFTAAAGPSVESKNSSLWRRTLGAAWGVAVAAERVSYVPDPRRLWAIAASRAAARLVATSKIDVVLTTSPPLSAHFVGMFMQRKFGIPWIADLRDLWVGRPYRSLPYVWQNRLDKVYERKVITRADQILLASPGWIPILKARYGHEIAEKISVITMGFDAALLHEAESETGNISPPGGSRQGIPLTIAYTGALHDGENPWPLARALVRVSEQFGVERVRDGFRVRLTGPGASDWDDLRNYLRKAGLDGVIQFLGTKTHAECLAEQQSADILLILSAPPHDETIRGKCFEYMAVGKTIFALLPERSTQGEILEPSGLATVVAHGDVEAIAAVLARWLIDGVSNVQPNWDYIRGFEWREINRSMAELLFHSVGETNIAVQSIAAKGRYKS